MTGKLHGSGFGYEARVLYRQRAVQIPEEGWGTLSCCRHGKIVITGRGVLCISEMPHQQLERREVTEYGKRNVAPFTQPSEALLLATSTQLTARPVYSNSKRTGITTTPPRVKQNSLWLNRRACNRCSLCRLRQRFPTKVGIVSNSLPSPVLLRCLKQDQWLCSLLPLSRNSFQSQTLRSLALLASETRGGRPRRARPQAWLLNLVDGDSVVGVLGRPRPSHASLKACSKSSLPTLLTPWPSWIGCALIA